MNAGLVTEQQVEEALRAQVMWGGRIGTCLIELAAVSMDDLSRALGKQHGLPAALNDHFNRGDRELQNQLDPDISEKFQIVPLVRAGKRVVIACTAPLSEKAVKLIAAAYDIEPAQLVQSIAPEMRIRFQMERLYDIPRGQRFLRSRGVTDQSQLFSLPGLSRDAGPAAIAKAATGVQTREPSESLGVPLEIDAPIREQSRPHEAGIERRTYLKTLADMLSKHPDKDSAIARVQRTKPIDPKQPFVTRSSAQQVKVDVAVIADTLNEALADIVLSRDRDDLARRVIGTVARFIPECHSALLLVVRGEAAVSWTSFCRDGTDLPALAVPIDYPGLVAATMRRKVTSRNASGDLGPIDYLLLASLGMQYGDLLVAPVVLLDHVIGMIVLASERRGATDKIDEIRAATGEAFTRLMKNAAA